MTLLKRASPERWSVHAQAMRKAGSRIVDMNYFKYEIFCWPRKRTAAALTNPLLEIALTRTQLQAQYS